MFRIIARFTSTGQAIILGMTSNYSGLKEKSKELCRRHGIPSYFDSESRKTRQGDRSLKLNQGIESVITIVYNKVTCERCSESKEHTKQLGIAINQTQKLSKKILNISVGVGKLQLRS